MFERLLSNLLVIACVALLTYAYFSTGRFVKVMGAFFLLFVWYVAYDIVVNHD